MRKLYDILKKKFIYQENLNIFYFNDIIEYEYNDFEFFIEKRNEFIIISQREDEDENEIFRISDIIFEEDDILLYEILFHFIQNQIEYLR